MTTKRAVAFSVFVSLGIIGTSSFAQELSRPELKVGDRWTYERTDRTKKVSEGIRENKVIAKSESEYRFESKNPSTGAIAEYAQDLNSNAVELTGGRRVKPYTPFFSWPLSVGKKWSADYSVPNSSGTGVYEEQRSCEVLAKESTQTKAGTFETMKISCQGKFRTPDNRGQSTLNGFTESVYWYAPAARQNVRIEYRDGTYNFGVWNNTADELVSMELK